MTGATLMAVLTLGRANAAVLHVTARLAAKMDAGVVGLGVCRPIEVICRDCQVPAAVFDADRRLIARQAEEAERGLRSVLEGRVNHLDWQMRSTVLPLAERIAQEARRADLLVIGLRDADARRDETRDVDLPDLVMQAGRPVLLVPETGAASVCERALVAWKDTREARRAVADALPLLAEAGRVTVVEIADRGAATEARQGVADVVCWLAHHGIEAEGRIVDAERANAFQLEDIARSIDADLIVAGAWGYSRDQRWVMGGITSALIGGTRRCALLSC
ncbi:MAG: universal stress protein [Pseudomonadota bacterium]